ncbi:MAG: hypothetical protein HZA93_13125 [Verrucomicrobia bacterium]|nr:hypothetical protein [Verrucomicrobiota bacterium]
MPRRLNRAVIESALETALFGVEWDAGVCEQRLAALATCAAEDPKRSHHIACAIDALQGAKASLASAERFAARLTKGGVR